MIRRALTDRVLTALSDRPVVLIAGVRQSGKTTLVRSLTGHGHHAQYVTLDDATALEAARGDPAGFLAALQGNTILDEVQHAPGLFPAIKLVVDRDRTPGRFLLTGSANVMVLPRISESLAGRMELLTLWPLSVSEIAGSSRSVCDGLFGEKPGFEDSGAGRPLRDRVLDAVAAGGFPEPLHWAPERRVAWFESYVTTMLRREVRDIAEVDGLVAMSRLLRILAARTAGLMNLADVARMAEFPYTTLRRYLAILEAAYLVCNASAWSPNVGLRSVKSPKVHLVDTGLASFLLDIERAALTAGSTMFGPLLESFVVSELRKDAGVSAVRPTVYHWRQHHGAEVDVVLEDRRGRVVGVEVKSSGAVGSGDVRHLRALSEQLGPRFLRGVIAYLGDSVIPFAPNIHAVPVGTLLGM